MPLPADLISTLSDDILSTIITRLSPRDLLRTSVLSHRFRRLKIFTPFLDLSASPSPDAALCHLLPRNHSPHININLIPTTNGPLLPLSRRSTPAIWIPHLAATLEKLTLSIAPNGNLNDILAIPSLRDLTLFGYNFRDTWQPPDNPVPGLRSLQVELGYARDYQIEALINTAPLLERLVLSDITLAGTGRSLQIRSDVLKLLQIETMELKSLRIDTPAVTTLMLNNLDQIEGNILINAPSLLILDTTTTSSDKRKDRYGGTMDSLIKKLYGISLSRAVQIPQISKKCDILVGIRKLFLEMDLRNYTDIRALRTLLGRCTNIQELGIDMSGLLLVDIPIESYERPSKRISWKRDDSFICLEHHLEHIWIKGFTGRELEMDFMRYILEKATMLQSVVILYDNYCRVTNLNELELIKTRTSSDWSITAKQGTSRRHGCYHTKQFC